MLWFMPIDSACGTSRNMPDQLDAGAVLLNCSYVSDLVSLACSDITRRLKTINGRSLVAACRCSVPCRSTTIYVVLTHRFKLSVQLFELHSLLVIALILTLQLQPAHTNIGSDPA